MESKPSSIEDILSIVQSNDINSIQICNQLVSKYILEEIRHFQNTQLIDPDIVNEYKSIILSLNDYLLLNSNIIIKNEKINDLFTSYNSMAISIQCSYVQEILRMQLVIGKIGKTDKSGVNPLLQLYQFYQFYQFFFRKLVKLVKFSSDCIDIMTFGLISWEFIF